LQDQNHTLSFDWRLQVAGFGDQVRHK